MAFEDKPEDHVGSQPHGASRPDQGSGQERAAGAGTGSSGDGGESGNGGDGSAGEEQISQRMADQIERDRRFRDALPEAMVNMDERLTKLRESAEAAQKAAQKLQAKVAKVEETMSWLELLGNLEALEAALEQRPLETSNVAHYARMELAERMAQAREILEALAKDEEKGQ